MSHPRFMLCLIIMCPAVIVLGGDIKDSLSTEKFENRVAERGDWSVSYTHLTLPTKRIV